MKKITAVLLTIITLFLISSNALALNVADESGILKDGKIKEFKVYDYAPQRDLIANREQVTDISDEKMNEGYATLQGIQSNSNVGFNADLLTSFNTVTAPKSANGANEPKFSYNEFLEESISDYSGELTLNFEDLVLEGRSGLDLRIGRTYQSVASEIGEKSLMILPDEEGVLRNTLVYKNSTYLLDRYNLGVGWGFSFPSVQIETEYIPEEIGDTYTYYKESQLYYHSGNGDVYQVHFTADASDSNLKGYYKKDIQFNQNDNGYSNGQITSAYSLTLSDKTKQYFAEDGRLIGIKDSFGNTIKFEHTKTCLVNMVPEGNFRYDDGMWESSVSADGADDAGVVDNKGKNDTYSMYFRRQNSMGNSFIASKPIQVKPSTEYTFDMSIFAKYETDVKIEIIGYDTAYNQRRTETMWITDCQTNNWQDFQKTFYTSSAMRYVIIKISPENANDMYIDAVSLAEPKPLISKITDSVGRTVEFEYTGDLYAENGLGKVSLLVKSPDGLQSRTLVYNKESVEFATKYIDYDEQRKLWYLSSSDTEGEDGQAVTYSYEGGTTIGPDNNLIYPRLYSKCFSKTHSSQDAYVTKPVLSHVIYKDREKIYEYETVRKHLGNDGYYDTLRVKSKYDKYLYVPEGSNLAYFTGQIGKIDYTYSGTYNGNSFNNESGYPNYTFDEDTTLNEKWTVTKTGKSVDTVTFSNSQLIKTTTEANGVKITNEYTNHTIFKNSPTEIKSIITQNNTSKETFVLYSYNDWGGIESESKEIDASIKNNSELLEKYKTTYQYNADYHYITEKSYYNNVEMPKVCEVYTYDNSGRLTENSDAVGKRTSYFYENTDFPWLITKSVQDDPMNMGNLFQGERVISYVYDSYGLYPTEICEDYDGTFAEHNYVFDYITGAVLKETMPDGAEKIYTYTTDGKVKTVTYPEVRYNNQKNFYVVERHIYQNMVGCDNYDSVLKVFNVEAIDYFRVFSDNTQEYGLYAGEVNFYDSVGNLKSHVVYDYSKVDSENYYLRYRTNYYHDAYDRLVKIVDNEGNETLYAYDEFDRTATVSDSEKNVYHYVYNDVQSTVQLILDGMTETENRCLLLQKLDNYGNVIMQTAYPNNNLSGAITESYSYDLNGNITSYTDPEGNKTEYCYDAKNRIKETKLPNGVGASASYTTFDFVSGERIYENNSSSSLLSKVYQHNVRGDLKRKFTSYNAQLSDIHKYSTDIKGRVSVVMEGENTKTFTYDQADNPIILTSGTSQINKYYNWHGESISVPSDSDISAVSYGYDMLGNISEKLQGGVHSIKYTYSTIGNKIKSVMPSQRVENYTYTPNGNLDTVVSDGNTFDYDYYDTGFIKSITYPNGLKTTYEYDNINRVTKVATTKNGTAINTFEYEYDNNGNITKEVRNGVATTYSYDNLNRLISVTYSDGLSVAYEYDAFNNRTKETYSNGDVKDYVYNAKYQLKEIKLNGQVTDTFTYNESGAVVTHNDKTYTYDEWDRMSGYSNGTDTYTYKYDANGIRTQKNDKQYIIDINNNVVAETDSTGAVTDEILWGHQPLARKTNGSWYYYIYNAHGDVVGLVNESGTVVNTYEYTPWGEIRNETETVDNPIKYAGEYYDDELDMIYLRARYYNPQIGRFTSFDIKEGNIASPLDMNRYVYCRNNPIKYSDPSGESALAVAVAIVGPGLVDGLATGTIYAFSGRRFGAGFVNGFVEGLTAATGTYIGGVHGAIIGSTLGSALGSMSEDLLYNKNKSVEDIAKSAASSAAWGLVGGLSNSYISKAIDIANEAGSAAQTLMKYDERFGMALKIFFDQLVNILSSQ